MLKVFSIQKAFSGFSSVIPNPYSIINPLTAISQPYPHPSHPLNLFSSLFKVMPSKADLLGSL